MRKAIFVVNQWSRNGGLEIVTQNAARAFVKAGFQVSIWSAASCGADYSEVGIAVHYLCPRNRILQSLWHRFLKFRYLAYILRKTVVAGDAVVFGHVYLLPTLNYVNLPAQTLRWVWTHDKEVWNEAGIHWKPWLDKLTRVVAVSKFTGDHARKGGTTTPVCVIENSIDTVRYVPTTSPEKIRRDEVLICSRIPKEFRYKGHERLLQALPIAEKMLGRPLRLRIIGHGPGLAELRELVKLMGLDDRVTLTGFVSDAEQLEAYQHCGVFCLPSTGEGFGLVYAEAESCARPVIVSTFGGAPETAIDGVTGLFVDPLDVESIARAIATLLADPEKADEMGSRGADLVQSKFSLAAFEDRVVRLIEKDLGD